VRLVRPATAVLALALAATALTAASVAYAAFASKTQNESDIVTAAPDFRAPVVGAVVVGKTQGGATGFVKSSGTYYVYANVAADTGNPASGIASVNADASAITTGSIAVTMSAGSFSAGGVSYGYRSAALNATNPQAEGAKSVAVTATDLAGNANTKGGAVTVDNTAPKASDVQTTNAGTNGLPEQNDTIVFTFSELVEPESILAGWTGAATNVVVKVNDNGLLGLPAGNDSFEIWNAANSAALPLGAVDLGRSDYAAGLLGGSYRFGATGTASKMSLSASTLTVVLGTYNSTIIVDAGRGTTAAAGTMVWTPVATPYDRATNLLSTTAASESGAADKDF
jgi:hypothetical protein